MPEVVGNLMGQADLGERVVPPSGQEARAGHRQVVEAEEEGAKPALGEPQIGRVGLPRLRVPVEVEQAVGADQVGIEPAVDDRARPLQRRRGLVGEVQRVAETPLPPAGAGDGLQPVGHRVSVTAGQGLVAGSLGGQHPRLGPGGGHDMHALRDQAMKPCPLGPGEITGLEAFRLARPRKCGPG